MCQTAQTLGAKIKNQVDAMCEVIQTVNILLHVRLINQMPPPPSGLPVFRSLLAESESKLLPDNDLLRRLRLVTQDAEKCSSVAQQLLNGKRQTR